MQFDTDDSRVTIESRLDYEKDTSRNLRLLAASSFTWASIIFDDFNSGMGVFNQNPNLLSTTANVATTSKTTWDTTASDLFEGAGVL